MDKAIRDKDDISYDIITIAKDKLINNYNRTHKIYKYLVEFENCIINSVKGECIKEIEKELREDYKNAFAVAINKILTKIANNIRDKE